MFAAKKFKSMVILAAFAFLLVSLFGVLHLGIDPMQEGNQGGPCALMPGVAICTMTPLQHISAAQNMLNAMPAQIDLASLLLLLLASLIALVPFLRQRLFVIQPILGRSISQKDTYIPRHFALQEIFASGILNSKAY